MEGKTKNYVPLDVATGFHSVWNRVKQGDIIVKDEPYVQNLCKIFANHLQPSHNQLKEYRNLGSGPIILAMVDDLHYFNVMKDAKNRTGTHFLLSYFATMLKRDYEIRTYVRISKNTNIYVYF